MNKRISPTLIGAFVVGALALVVIAVIAFGSGELFRQTKQFVLFFPGEVNGLRVAAPVKFRGVEIGSVKQILLQLEPDLKVQRIPVVIEIDLKKLTSRGASGAALNDPKAFKALIDQGLRGQLRTESLVTGVLYVGLDLFPGTAANFFQSPESKKYEEIPTVPTAFEQAQDAATKIIAKLEEIDFKGLMNSTKATLDGINQLVSSPALKSSLQALDETMPKVEEAVLSLNKLANTVDVKISDLSDDFRQTSAAAREAMQRAGITMKQTDSALQAAEAAMVNIKGAVDPNSPTFYELTKSLREVSSAARSLRLLANSIERNPRSLIFGKPENTEGQ
jgi:phospholipid/cholesterol/gamma-HCH transport system substrate-binding protein